jgi:hypothetical protein
METNEQAHIRGLTEENKALRAGITAMHRRAQQNEGARRKLQVARRSFMHELAREKLRIARYEQLALADKDRYLDDIEKAYAESWVSKLLRAIGLHA